MNEKESLLRQIIENPDDDDIRLVYADWLMEHGDRPDQIARGELIQAQIEIERLPTCANGCQRQNRLCRRCFLEDSVRHLLSQHGGRWRQESLLDGEIWNDPDDYELRFYITWQRGFVQSLSCRLEDWIGSVLGGPAMLMHPVEHIFITDREPLVRSELSGFTAYWYILADGMERGFGGYRDLPALFFDCPEIMAAGEKSPESPRVIRYSADHGRTRSGACLVAMTALSNACLGMSRRKAGIEVKRRKVGV